MALLFNTNSDLGHVPDNAAFDPTVVTVEAWVRTAGLASATVNHWIFSHLGSAGNNNNAGFALSVNHANDTINWFIHDGTALRSLTGTLNAIVVDTWFHIAATYTNPNLRIYIDGVENATNATGVGALSASDSKVLIGSRGSDELTTSATEFFGGDGTISWNAFMKEIRIWNVERTATEINANKGKIICTPYPSSLVGYWRADENSGTTLTDLIAARNITLVSTAWDNTVNPTISTVCGGVIPNLLLMGVG